MADRDLGTQKWLWDDCGIEVFEFEFKERHHIDWKDIKGISLKQIRTDGLTGIFFRGSPDDIKSLREDLTNDWKKHYPEGWAESVKRQSKLLQKLFVVYFPILCFVLMGLPWICLFIYMYAKGYYHHETFDKCIRGIVISLVCSVGLIGYYYIWGRKLVQDDLGESESKEDKNSS